MRRLHSRVNVVTCGRAPVVTVGAPTPTASREVRHRAGVVDLDAWRRDKAGLYWVGRRLLVRANCPWVFVKLIHT